jgi:hypothetical protein
MGHFESKERRAEVCVLRDRVRRHTERGIFVFGARMHNLESCILDSARTAQ